MLLFRGLGQAVTFATLIILGRYLGPELFGRYSFLFGILAFFAIPLTPAINDLIVREVINRPNDRSLIIRSGIGLRLIFTILGMAAAVIVIPLLGAPGVTFQLVALCSLSLLFSLWMPSWRFGLETPFQIDFRMDSASGINIVGRLVILGLLGIGSLTGAGLPGIVTLQISGEIAATLLLVVLIIRLGYDVKPTFSRPETARLWRLGLPLILTELFVVAFSRSDILILEAFHGETEVGVFSVSMRLVEAFQLMASVFLVTAIPLLSKIHTDEPERFGDAMRLSYKVMTAVALAIAVPLAIYGGDIIILLFGGKYAASGAVLTMLAWTVPLLFGVATIRMLLVAAHLEGYLPRLFLIIAVVNILLNLALVPHYGAVGAGIAKIITFGSLFPLAILFRKTRRMGIDFVKIAVLPVGVAIIVREIFIRLDLSVFIGVPIVVIIVSATAYFSGWFGRREIKRIRSFLAVKRI